MAKLTAQELSVIAERRRQARANGAIEGIQYSAEHEAMFEAFDAEDLSHEERLERIRQRLIAPHVSAE